MAEFVFIENYHRSGKLGINRKCFEEICSVVTNKIAGVSTKSEKNNSNPMFTFDKPVRCDVINNKLNILIQVIVRQGVNVDEICTLIQKEVADCLTSMVETVPFSIKIKVAGIE